MDIKKGDVVRVIAGKDLGKKGKVLKAIPKENRVVVEGVNRAKKHQRRPGYTQGGILQVESRWMSQCYDPLYQMQPTTGWVRKSLTTRKK
jgi:ribosomal protein L24